MLKITYELLINNPLEMFQLSQQLAKVITKTAIIYLIGNIGVGKTTLNRGILQNLGYKGAIKSPTYTIVEYYNINGQRVYHFDLYRLVNSEELEYIGGRDYFEEDSICLIEWPYHAVGALPDADLEIQLDYNLPGRKASIKAGTLRGDSMLNQLQKQQEILH